MSVQGQSHSASCVVDFNAGEKRSYHGGRKSTFAGRNWLSAVRSRRIVSMRKFAPLRRLQSNSNRFTNGNRSTSVCVRVSNKTRQISESLCRPPRRAGPCLACGRRRETRLKMTIVWCSRVGFSWHVSLAEARRFARRRHILYVRRVSRRVCIGFGRFFKTKRLTTSISFTFKIIPQIPDWPHHTMQTYSRERGSSANDLSPATHLERVQPTRAVPGTPSRKM